MENTHSNSDKKVRKITLGSIIGWVIGIGSLILVFTTIKTNILASILYLILALILIPPFSKKIQTTLNLTLSKGVKVLIILVVMFAIGSITEDTNQAVNNADKNIVTDTVENKEVLEETVVSVTATKILSDYEENEVSADSVYKDKYIEITGSVDTIGKDILDTPYISLKNGDQYSFSSVQCMFMTNRESDLVDVKKGQPIKLKGKVSGILGNIIVRDCTIVK